MSSAKEAYSPPSWLRLQLPMVLVTAIPCFWCCPYTKLEPFDNSPLLVWCSFFEGVDVEKSFFFPCWCMASLLCAHFSTCFSFYTIMVGFYLFFWQGIIVPITFLLHKPSFKHKPCCRLSCTPSFNSEKKDLKTWPLHKLG